ncbi:MAG TPA: hypothetical protein VF705_05095, partial [Longimicrobium sp.]
MSRVDNFIIREGGGTRFANTLVLGQGLEIVDTAGGIPELAGSAFTGAKVWLAGNVNAPSHTETPIPFTEEALDTDGFWTAAQPARFTVPAGRAGVYMVVARGVFGAGPSAVRISGFRKNGAVGGLTRVEGAGSSLAATATEIVRLEENDYVEMRVYQESGATLPVIGGTPYETS